MANTSQKQPRQLSDLLTQRQNHEAMLTGAFVVLRDAFGAYPCYARLRLGEDEPRVEFVDPAANKNGALDESTFRIDLCDVAGVHSIAVADGQYRGLHLNCILHSSQSSDDVRRAAEELPKYEDYVIDFQTVPQALQWRRELAVLLGQVEVSPHRSSRALSPARHHQAADADPATLPKALLEDCGTEVRAALPSLSQPASRAAADHLEHHSSSSATHQQRCINDVRTKLTRALQRIGRLERELALFRQGMEAASRALNVHLHAENTALRQRLDQG